LYSHGRILSIKFYLLGIIIDNKRVNPQKAKAVKAGANLRQRIANLKASLKPAYKSVGTANKRSHETNGKISELNYETVSQTGKRQVIHVNCMKKAQNPRLWKPESEQRAVKKPQRRRAKRSVSNDEEEEEFAVGSYPLVVTDYPTHADERLPAPDRAADSPDPAQPTVDTPSPQRNDPSYHPPDTPRSRIELQTTRIDPPVTRSRARVMSQNSVDL
jgi:hypothetical protein